MDSQRIKILLNRYFEATSTLEEENELITYFNSGKVADELKLYIPIFTGLNELAMEEVPGLEDQLMHYILETDTKEKGKARWIWHSVTGVAAAILLAMLAVNIYSHDNQWNDTFNDPQQAYVEANKTLQLVAGNYNKGMAQLHPLKKVEEATSSLYSGIKTLNQGMEKLENIENLNSQTKKY